jgi:hypothetical protein
VILIRKLGIGEGDGAADDSDDHGGEGKVKHPGTIKLAPLNNATTVGNGFLADSLFVIEDEKDLSANVRRALPNSKDTCCVVM